MPQARFCDAASSDLGAERLLGGGATARLIIEEGERRPEATVAR